MDTVLETQGLAKRYGQLWALSGIDLQVGKGEVFGFLGPNGAGKTTFTKCITGFIRPDAGRITLAGEDARRNPTRVARHVGLVPDQYDFYPNLTGRQHLDFYGRLHGMSAAERKDRIEAVLQQVRMTGRADSRTKTYSHGMKQRICIAQAMLHRPQLILFDEPTNGLDPKGAYELREMIRGLARDGTTVFLNSHLLHEVEQVCERVAIVDKGRLLKVGRVDDLVRDLQGRAMDVEIRLQNPLKKFIATASKAGAEAPHLEAGSLRFGGAVVPEVVAALAAQGARIEAVLPRKVDLESVFLELTADTEEGA